MLRVSYRGAKRIVVAVVGVTLLLCGVVLIPLPGPGTPVVFLALTVLASEFAWAALWLRRVRVTSRRAGRRARGRSRWRKPTPPAPPSQSC